MTFEEVTNEFEQPESLWYLWDWYLRLSNRRRYDQGVAQPLGWIEVEAYFRLVREQPTQWEINLIMHLDAVEMSAGAKKG